MPKGSIHQKVKKGYHNADDICYLFTGVRLRKVEARAFDLFVDFIKDKIKPVQEREAQELDDWYLSPDNPYRTLGVSPDALDMVVKAAFRSLVREFHPDTGLHPDTKRFARIVECYNDIMSARAEARQQENNKEASGEPS